jgi:hypothetical protein
MKIIRSDKIDKVYLKLVNRWEVSRRKNDSRPVILDSE